MTGADKKFYRIQLDRALMAMGLMLEEVRAMAMYLNNPEDETVPVQLSLFDENYPMDLITEVESIPISPLQEWIHDYEETALDELDWCLPKRFTAADVCAVLEDDGLMPPERRYVGALIKKLPNVRKTNEYENSGSHGRYQVVWEFGDQLLYF